MQSVESVKYLIIQAEKAAKQAEKVRKAEERATEKAAREIEKIIIAEQKAAAKAAKDAEKARKATEKAIKEAEKARKAEEKAAEKARKAAEKAAKEADIPTEECCICLENHKIKHMHKLSKCGHLIGRVCANRWLMHQLIERRALHCPLCRTPIEI